MVSAGLFVLSCFALPLPYPHLILHPVLFTNFYQAPFHSILEYFN